MGGAILIAIRHTMNGSPEEVIMDRWTNDYPWRFMQPSFQDQGAELKEYCTEILKPDHQGWECHVKSVYPSEYGFVLIDFPTRSILSRQGYSMPVRFYFGPHSTALLETAPGLVEMAKRGVMDIMKGFGPDSKLITAEEFIQFASDPKNYTGYQNWSFVVSLKPGIWNIDAKDKVPGLTIHARKWMKERGWKAKVGGNRNLTLRNNHAH